MKTHFSRNGEKSGSVETCARVHAVSKQFLRNIAARLNLASDVLTISQTGVLSQNVSSELAKPKKGKVDKICHGIQWVEMN